MNNQEPEPKSEFVDLTHADEDHKPVSVDEPVSVTNDSAQLPSPKKRSKLILVPFLLIGLIACAVAGVYAYNNFFISPEQVMAKVYQNSQKIKTYSYDGEISFSYRLNNNSITSVFFPTSFGAKFKGSTDVTDPNNSKSNANIDVLVNQNHFATIDVIGVGKVSYVRLTDLVKTGVDSFDNSDLKGQWLKIDPTSLQNNLGNTSSDVSKALSTEDMNKIKNIFLDNNPIKIDKKLDYEEMDGQQTFHYSYEIDKDKIVEIVKELEALFPDLNSTVAGTTTDKELKDALDMVTVLNGEIWVGKQDLLVHKITFIFKVEDKKTNQGSFGMNLTFHIGGYGEPVNITEPTDAKDFNEILNSLYGNQFEQARDTQRRADLLSIGNAIYQYAAENNGLLPGGDLFPRTETCIGISTKCYNLGSVGSPSLVSTYISAIPQDPSSGTKEDTGYTIYLESDGRIVIKAKGELTPEITVMR